ncbi:MAG: FtsL-like putative cell division protein [Prevotella sp.]|jgi:hypothetical protein
MMEEEQINHKETSVKAEAAETNSPTAKAEAEDEKKESTAKERQEKTQEERDAEDLRTFKKVIKAEAHEGDGLSPQTLSLRKVLGGDILNTNFIKNQIGLFLLITLFLVIYIANRYSVQQDLIKIDKLHNELQDVKYKALSTSSELTERSRESNVLNQLQSNKDSVLKIPNQPPYIIVVPDE